ncbi:acyltransferase family protein [Roseomonas haemaphysalidis]|uniref:Acyltransferase n=1 Tax=Roseomonas haemaphysalidis TaxID=2768162 RepID=A0ABS3KQ98_9PROT|nr:acyltransferase [Roseomonas haemaphysalidis]MBO1079616.1 acyltransferase [Roseomonas haemaphysalidis]
MGKSLSAYLDLLRFLAAMIVFLGHLAGARFTAGIFWQLSNYMDEAVTIFFVISGFVIGYVVLGRGEDRDGFVVARVSRIVSVAIPALIATAFLDAAGQAIRPELYSADWGFSNEHPFLQYLGSLLFLNRIWHLNLDVGSNLPYWSLNYEVWYYILFGVAAFARSATRWIGVPIAAAICGPEILVLFPVWLFGVGAYAIVASNRIGPRTGMALFAMSIVAFITYDVAGGRAALGLPLIPGLVNRADALHDYVVGILFTANLIGFAASAPVLGRFILPISRPVRWAAGATFTIYLFHLPVAQFLTTILPWPPTSWATRIILLCGSTIILFLIAEVTERRKDDWRPVGVAVLSLIRGRRAASPRADAP